MDDEINDHDGISLFLFYSVLFSSLWHTHGMKCVGPKQGVVGTKHGLCRGFWKDDTTFDLNEKGSRCGRLVLVCLGCEICFGGLGLADRSPVGRRVGRPSIQKVTRHGTGIRTV
jgi:hypothetical protein